MTDSGKFKSYLVLTGRGQEDNSIIIYFYNFLNPFLNLLLLLKLALPNKDIGAFQKLLFSITLLATYMHPVKITYVSNVEEG